MTEQTSAQDLFKGRNFDQEIIILCVRWYLAFKLSSRDLVQMMAERAILLAHTTILRWLQRYVPDFEKRWLAYALPVGDSWRVDETYIKVRSQWVYLYRARKNPMNYINQLQHACKDPAAASREAENAINDLIIYLNSPKFYRDTTVQVSHVFHVLVPIRNQVSSIAQELERP